MKMPDLFRILASGALLLLAAETRAQLTGTLFTQPEEREYLDYLREEFLRNNAEGGFDIEEVAIPDIPEGVAATQTGPTEFAFGGIMSRRDGSRSVWLNGRLLQENDLPAGISVVIDAGSTSLRISNNGSTYVLRPGQMVNLVNGTVVENFQRPPPAETAATALAETAVSAGNSVTAPATADAGTTEASAAPDERLDQPAESGNVDADSIAAAVEGLDDREVEALFDALESRRQQREETEEESDGEADDEEP